MGEELFPDSWGQQHRYCAMNFDGGKAPFDMLGIGTIWAQEFAKAVWIVPLDELMPPAEQSEFFLPWADRSRAFQRATVCDLPSITIWYGKPHDASAFQRDAAQRSIVPPCRTVRPL